MTTHQPLRLHVPEPTGRPGCATDFSYLHLSPAGAVRRPPVDTAPPDTADLAYALIRVLDDDGKRRRPVGARDLDRAAAQGPARDDEDAHLRRPHADRAAPEEDLVLHAEPGRGGDRAARMRWRSSAGDMCFPTYRQQGLLLARDDSRWST